MHGRFSGFGAPVKLGCRRYSAHSNGVLVEHWDVIQDEATDEQSIRKRPVFGTTFPAYA